VNDTYGHLFGDIVLQGVAHKLHGSARRSDIVARFGGEEFAVLLIDTSLSAASFVAERLRSSVEASEFQVRKARIRVTASFGLACTENVGSELSPETLIHAADRALFASKDAGRNCIHLCNEGQIVRSVVEDVLKEE